MARKRKRAKTNKKPRIVLPKDLERKIIAILIFLAGLIFLLSFFDQAGQGGELIRTSLFSLLGRAAILVPLAFFVYPLLFLKRKEIEKFNDLTIALAIFSFILLFSALIVVFEIQEKGLADGGQLGYWIALLPLKIFGPLVTELMLGFLIFIDLLIFSQILKSLLPEKPGLAPEQAMEPVKVTEEKPGPVFRPAFLKKFRGEPKKKEVAAGIERPLVQPVSLEYQSPALTLLEKQKGGASGGNLKENARIIQQTLENFGIEVRMGEINVGPTVTQYTLEPAPGIKLSKITGLSNNLALALASHPIRIEAPIPGRPLVGVEVPNKKRVFVRLRELLGDDQFQKSLSSLTFALGKDVSGGNVFADLGRMPHLLVAGSTGTGKTVCLNSIIMSLLYKNSPKALHFIFVDPKRVEFTAYNGLPHLLYQVIYGAEEAVSVLRLLVEKMEERFIRLSQKGAKDINTYNQMAVEGSLEVMPYIILIIDELADLMASRGREVEAGIVRLAQMARAVGIHLVVATQRPSVEVLTGLIKANITSRITFQVASQVDSRTVLDIAGAEKLLGLGDMLFVSSEVSKPKRVQGVFVSEKEISRVVKWISQGQTEKIKRDEFKEQIKKKLEEKKEEIFFAEDDPLFEQAKQVVIRAKKGSASLLQRRLSIGYARAARLLDMLEAKAIVGPARGAKPREVYFEGREEL